MNAIDQISGKREHRMVALARECAEQAHRGQVRKYTGEAYIAHPAAVVHLIASVPHDTEMLCAAWLHDVVEDCGMSLKSLQDRFGKNVALLVEELTDVATLSDGTRAERKARERERMSITSVRAKTIKLADVIDNSRNIVSLDLKFAKVYMQEKRALLSVLQEGDATLLAIATKIVANYYLSACET